MKEVFLQYFDDVYRYVSRRVGDKSQIHTIVRDSFLDAVKYMGHIEETSSGAVLTNLYKIAYNHLLTIPQARPYLFGPKSAAIQKVLDLLDPEDQEIVRLKFWEDVPDRDIATIVGLNPRRIDVKVLQSIKHFKEHWPDSEDYPEAQYFSSIASAFTTAKVEQAITADGTLRESLHDELADTQTETLTPQRSPLATFAKIIWLIRAPIILGVLLLLAFQFNVFENLKNLLTPKNTQTQVAQNNENSKNEATDNVASNNQQNQEETGKIKVFSGTGKYIPEQKSSNKTAKTEKSAESEKNSGIQAGGKESAEKPAAGQSPDRFAPPIQHEKSLEKPSQQIPLEQTLSPAPSPLYIEASTLTFPGKYVLPSIRPVAISPYPTYPNTATFYTDQDINYIVQQYCMEGTVVSLTPQCYAELRSFGVPQGGYVQIITRRRTWKTYKYKTYEIIPGMTEYGTTFTLTPDMVP